MCESGVVRLTTKLDVRVAEDVLGAARPGHPVLLGLYPGAVGQEVADGDHAHVRERGEVLEVGVADDTGSDDADPDRLAGALRGAHAMNPPSRRNA